MSLKNFASNVSSKAAKQAVDFSPITAFLVQCQKDGVRLGYEGLATLAYELGLAQPSGMSLGQVGAMLVKKLPQSVQSHVCRKNGGYDIGAISWDPNLAKTLRKAPVIAKEQVVDAYKAFLESLKPVAAPSAQPVATAPATPSA